MSPRLRSYAAIGAATLVPLAVYVASLRGDVSFWDTGDLQTVPYILGIPYPTGFPRYVLIGWVWSHAFAIGSDPWRLNLRAARATSLAAGALAAGLLALGVLEVLAAAGALAFAFATIVWERATYVDAHRIALAAAIVALVFALRWLRDGRWSAARGVGFAAAVALAIDDATILMMPALAIVVWGRRPPLRDVATLLAACAVVVAGAYAYLPIRSAIVSAAHADPTLALGIAAGRPFWDDHHPASVDGFIRLVAGTEFAPHAAAAEMISARALLRVVTDAGPPARRDFGDIGLALALIGALICARREPRILAGLLAFAALPLLFVVSYGVEADGGRYFAPAYAVIALLAAYGASALAVVLRPPLLPAFAVAGAAAFVALLLSDVTWNGHLFAQRTALDASPFVDRVVAKTAPDAILVAPWVYAPPLAYRAYVEHGLGARVVVTGWPSDYEDRYSEWSRSRPVIVVGHLDADLAKRTQLLDDGDPSLSRVVR